MGNIRVKKVEQLNVSQWLAMPTTLRELFGNVFKIKRSGFVHVQDNNVVSDGHSYDDLKVVNTESLQDYTKLETRVFSELLQAAIDKITTPVVEKETITNGK